MERLIETMKDKNSDKTVDVFMACRIMPYYRLGIFQELTKVKGKYTFYFYGDTEEQNGIKQIPISYKDAEEGENIRWIKTKNYFTFRLSIKRTPITYE